MKLEASCRRDRTPLVEKRELAASESFFSPTTRLGAVFVRGVPLPPRMQDLPSSRMLMVSPGFFDAMGMPLVRGRDFSDREVAGSPKVAVVNESLARRRFPNENSIGLRFDTVTASPAKRCAGSHSARPALAHHASAPHSRGCVVNIGYDAPERPYPPPSPAPRSISMSKPYEGISTTNGIPGISGSNPGGDGVVGVGHRGVVGQSDHFQGVFGKSTDNAGVVGESQNFHAIFGVSHSVHNGALFGTNDAAGYGVIGRGLIGVSGESTGGLQGVGVIGSSPGGDGVVGRGHRGVRGESDEFQGVSGYSKGNAGVFGESENLSGVYAVSHHPHNAGLFATNDRGGPAAHFAGNVDVTGVINLLGADIAEDFDVEDGASIVPGSVVRVGDAGGVGLTTEPYDTAVVGIVAGAPGFRPALKLDGNPTGNTRLPVTLMGKVMCLVDATSAPVKVGDLLTSSPTPGHAMKLTARERGVGAVLGKALRSLESGRGLVPVLAMLR